MVLWEPTITVRVNGVVEALLPTVSCSPVGLVPKVRSTVWGSRRTLAVSVSPPLSVAVSCSSIQAGYSWSGAVNEPLATPLKSWTAWVWQSVGAAQWCRISDQDSLVAGRVPSWGSLAWPEKPMVSPTVQVRVGVGVSMTAVGGEFPAAIVTERGR
jgi:hypothetical protein